MAVEHNTLGNTANMHGVVFATVANAAALAAVTATAGQVADRSVWLQTDTGQLWVPKSTTAGDFVPLVTMASAAPAALGVAAVGTATKAAREDHVHAMPTLDQVGAPAADVAFNNKNVTGVKTTTLNGVIDDGNSGSAKTIDFSTGAAHKVTLTANTTLSFTAPSGPCHVQLRIIQDATGGRTITWPAINWANKVVPTISSAASATDIVSLWYDGSAYYGVIAFNFG